MLRIIVFAGTNEGRKLCEFIANKNIEVSAVVATEYGAMVLPKNPLIKVKEGRLSFEEIENTIRDYDYIIDATHPYAKIISENIKIASQNQNKKMIRIIRPSLPYDNVVECKDIEEACKYLNKTKGNILVTTGSKELVPYTTIENYKQRVYLRVLPTKDAIEACNDLGFKATNIICMQGPFSLKMNNAILEQINAKYLVTKDSGKSGGFEEKILSAKEMGVTLILIGRPCKEEGITLQKAMNFFDKKIGMKSEKNAYFPMFFNLKDKKVLIIGAGIIASRRIKALLSFGANITVIAPESSKEVNELSEKNQIVLIKKNYESSDLQNAFIVISATNDREVNNQVYLDSKTQGIWANITDKKEQCDFFFPAIFEDEDVIGGIISKEGNKHTIVKEKATLIRDFLKGKGNEI